MRKTGCKSPIQNFKTLEVQAQDKRVIKNVCKGFVKPPLFLIHLDLYFFFFISFCNLNLMF